MIKLANRALNISPSPTLSIDAKAKKMASGGLDVVNFGVGEPDFDTPAHIKQAAVEAINKGMTKYTPVAGTDRLRSAIAKKLKEDNGLEYQPSQIVVSAGAKHSLYNAFQVLCQEGDEVILPAPYWVSYLEQIKLSGGVPIILQTRASNGFKLTMEELESVMTRRTRLIVLNSPSNPTGSVYTRSELEALGEVLARQGVGIISDEIYEKLVFDGWKHWSIGSFPGMKERTLTVNGVSKSYSMTGWRLGYVAGPRNLISAMAQLKYAITICTTSISQMAALEALAGPQDSLEEVVRVYDDRRFAAMTHLDKLGMPYVVPRGAFYIFPDIRKYGMTSFDFCRFMLEKAQVMLFPGTAFGPGGEGFVRISLLSPTDKINEAFERIEKALEVL